MDPPQDPFLRRNKVVPRAHGNANRKRDNSLQNQMAGMHIANQILHPPQANLPTDDIPLPAALGPAVYGTRPNVGLLKDPLANDPTRTNWAPDPLPPSPFTVNNPSGAWMTITRGVFHCVGNPPDRRGNIGAPRYGTAPGEAPLSWKNAREDAWTNGISEYNHRCRLRRQGKPDHLADVWKTPEKLFQRRPYPEGFTARAPMRKSTWKGQGLPPALRPFWGGQSMMGLGRGTNLLIYTS